MTVSRSIFHQTLACSPALFNQFMIGIGYGWVGPTLIKLRSADSVIPNVNEDQASWIAAVGEVGKILGPFISPLLVDRLGRRYTTLIVAVLYFILSVIILFARDVVMIYVARVLFGIANGITDVVNAIYIAENCSPSFRGILSSCIVLTFFGALFLEYVIATYLSYLNTAIVNTIFACFVFVALYYSTETPFFLIMKGDYKRAKKNLQWLRSGVPPDEVADELQQIERSVSEEKSQMDDRFFERFKSPANIKALCIVIGLCVLGTFCGAGAFLMYGPLIFSSSSTLTAEQFAIFYNAAQFITVIMSPFIIEKFNRRTLIVGAYVGMTISNVCSYVLLFLHGKNYVIVFYPWLIFASIAAFGMILPIASTASYAVKGELLPLSVRAIGSSMGVVSQSIGTFCILKVFLVIRQHYGVEANFFFYMTSSCLACIFIYFVLPETRGKSLYEIQNSLKTETTKNSNEEAEKMLDKSRSV